MRQIFILLGLFSLSFFSCKKVTINKSLNGLYTEDSPVSRRSILNFISNALVVKSESGSSYKDTFNYSLSAGKIILIPVWTNQYSGTQLDFKIIDQNSFQIENLYASIPEAPKNYMTFKK